MRGGALLFLGAGGETGYCAGVGVASLPGSHMVPFTALHLQQPEKNVWKVLASRGR